MRHVIASSAFKASVGAFALFLSLMIAVKVFRSDESRVISWVKNGSIIGRPLIQIEAMLDQAVIATDWDERYAGAWDYVIVLDRACPDTFFAEYYYIRLKVDAAGIILSAELQCTH